MKIMDERLYSKFNSRSLGYDNLFAQKAHWTWCMKLQKRSFYFEETVVLPLKWHLYFNDVMKANDVHGSATILFHEDTTLHLPFLQTP